MSAWFFAIAAAMLAAALACVLVPMLRSARRNGRPRAPFVLALIVAFALPPLAAGLYALYGAPRGSQSASDSSGMTLATASAQLRTRLQQHPDDRDGWILLAQAYSAMNRPADARDAFGHALRLAHDDPDLMTAYAEADAQARPDHRIDGEARALLQRAVALQPDHQRGLWLLGISDYQLGRYDEAAAHWQHLLGLLPPGSNLAVAVQRQIAMAQARVQGAPPAQAAAAASTAAAQITAAVATASGNANAQSPVALKVRVRLDPELTARVAPGDALFVYARAIDGPSMPLAVARLRASQLPATVTLTDAMAMSPQLKLSMYPRVQVSARISKSRNALPQVGDPEATPVPAATDSHKPIALMIDHLH